MRPLSRGMSRLAHPDPATSRRSTRDYMDEERDRRAVIAGMRIVREWFRRRPWLVTSSRKRCRAVTCERMMSSSPMRGQTGTTVFHASCSCRMGPDAMSVVDDQLRVHGLDGLRVIDASVMPAVTSTNTNAPTIMIAEKGAVLVKAAARRAEAACGREIRILLRDQVVGQGKAGQGLQPADQASRFGQRRCPSRLPP